MPVITVRRRPTTNRALPWTGTNEAEARAFLGKDFAGVRDSDRGPLLLIRTLEHRNEPFEAPPGSVVMEGAIHGEHWAVGAMQFADGYDQVGADELLAASEFDGMLTRFLDAESG